MKPILGFVGIGNIGEPVCRNLLEGGYKLLVYDVDPEALARLRDTSAEPVASLATLASRAEVILLSLPNSDIVEEVVFGEGGLEDGLSGDETLIDTSSSKPSTTRSIAKRLAARGIVMLDAPVSGGVLRAREGALAVMVGGKPEVYDRCREVLQSFGDGIFYLGEHGSGNHVKALNIQLSGHESVLAPFPEAGWFEALRDAAAADDELAVIGRWCTLDLVLAVDENLVLLRLREGRISEIIFDPDIGISWSVTLRGTLEDWRTFLRPVPPPFYSDLLAMNSRVPSFAIEGHRKTFVRHLRALGRLFEIARLMVESRA